MKNGPGGKVVLNAKNYSAYLQFLLAAFFVIIMGFLLLKASANIFLALGLLVTGLFVAASVLAIYIINRGNSIIFSPEGISFHFGKREIFIPWGDIKAFAFQVIPLGKSRALGFVVDGDFLVIKLKDPEKYSQLSTIAPSLSFFSRRYLSPRVIPRTSPFFKYFFKGYLADLKGDVYVDLNGSLSGMINMTAVKLKKAFGEKLGMEVEEIPPVSEE